MSSRRLSAAGVRLLAFVSRRGIPPFLRRAYRLRRTPSGFPRSAPERCVGGGGRLYSGAVVSEPGVYSTARPRCGRDSVSPLAHYRRVAIVSCRRPNANGASSTVHLRSSVPTSPGPVAPYGSGLPWAFPRALQPVVTNRPLRGGDAAGHLLGSGCHPPAPLSQSDLRVARIHAYSTVNLVRIHCIVRDTSRRKKTVRFARFDPLNPRPDSKHSARKETATDRSSRMPPSMPPSPPRVS